LIAVSVVAGVEPGCRNRQAKHLHVLAGAGLARGTRSGRERLWELEPERSEVARRFLDHISRRWDAALDKLKAHVEN